MYKILVNKSTIDFTSFAFTDCVDPPLSRCDHRPSMLAPRRPMTQGPDGSSLSSTAFVIAFHSDSVFTQADRLHAIEMASDLTRRGVPAQHIWIQNPNPSVSRGPTPTSFGANARMDDPEDHPDTPSLEPLERPEPLERREPVPEVSEGPGFPVVRNLRDIWDRALQSVGNATSVPILHWMAWICVLLLLFKLVL
jgi:hypothetical protein